MGPGVSSLHRIPGWEDAARKVLAEKAVAPFGYGTHDCCITCADVVLAITGIDFAAEWRGYASREEITEVYKEYRGARGLADHFAKQFNCPPVHPMKMQRCDALVVNTPTGYALGVRDMDEPVALAPAPDVGFARLDLSAVLYAWRVG